MRTVLNGPVIPYSQNYDFFFLNHSITCGEGLPHKPTPLSCWLISVAMNFLCLLECWPQVDLWNRVMMMGTFWHICSLMARLHELNMHLSKTTRVQSAPAACYLVCGSYAPFLRRMSCQVAQGSVPACPPTFGPKSMWNPADWCPDVFRVSCLDSRHVKGFILQRIHITQG